MVGLVVISKCFLPFSTMLRSINGAKVVRNCIRTKVTLEACLVPLKGSFSDFQLLQGNLIFQVITICLTTAGGFRARKKSVASSLEPFLQWCS